jgi:mono/diheme cytochrome c family protein
MKRTLLFLIVVMMTASCGGGEEPTEGTELLGAELFSGIVVGGKAGCASCHSLDAGNDGIGPSLAGVGALAGERLPGMSAADYLREAIIDPDSYVVEGYGPGIMPKGWDLSDSQIDSLVDFLLDR